MSEPRPAAELSLPPWCADQEEFELLCRRLGVPASAALRAGLNRHMRAQAAARPVPGGLAGRLAFLRPGALELGFLDAWTRLLWRGHPWRLKLNAVVALAECEGEGFAALSRRETEFLPAARDIAAGLLRWAFDLAAGAAWLLARAALEAAAGPWPGRAFAGKTVLVTGASRGLGLALAERLLAGGARVVAAGRDAAALAALARQAGEAGLGGRLIPAPADVSVPGALEAALAAAGVPPEGVDAAFINAGIKDAGEGLLDHEALRRTFAVNFFGAALTARALLPAWRRRGSGRLVFVSSQGRRHGIPATGGYNASKAALGVLADSLALELEGGGVGVTVLEPGLVRTGMIAGTGLQALLSISAAEAAEAALSAAARGRARAGFPLLFELLARALGAAPRGLRARLLKGAR